MQKSEILTFTTIWIELESIMLSKSVKERIYDMISFICRAKGKKTNQEKDKPRNRLISNGVLKKSLNR